MDYAVQTRGLARSYGDVRALDGIDLDITKGEIYGFLGPNGAGKTTLVRILITLLLPSRGSASVAGFDVLTEPNDIRLRIGAALQEAALDPKQTGPRDTPAAGPALWSIGEGDRHPDRRARRPDGHRRRDRSVRRDLLWRYEASARSGGVVDPQSADTVPRRADDRLGPDQPAPGVGGGQAHQPGARGYDLSYDALSGRGRRARRPHRHHKSRPADGGRDPN